MPIFWSSLLYIEFEVQMFVAFGVSLHEKWLSISKPFSKFTLLLTLNSSLWFISSRKFRSIKRDISAALSPKLFSAEVIARWSKRRAQRFNSIKTVLEFRPNVEDLQLKSTSNWCGCESIQFHSTEWVGGTLPLEEERKRRTPYGFSIIALDHFSSLYFYRFLQCNERH